MYEEVTEGRKEEDVCACEVGGVVGGGGGGGEVNVE